MDEKIFSYRTERSRTYIKDAFNSADRMLAGTEMSGVDVFGWTKGQFSLFDLLSAVLKRTGPADVFISVWTAADADLRDAYAFIERGAIRDFRLLIDRSFETRQKNYVQTVKDLFGGDSVRIARTHAKVALVSTDDVKIAIRTSMNLNCNPRWEQFEMTDDAALFSFIRGVFDDAWAEDAMLGSPNNVVEQATDAPFQLS